MSLITNNPPGKPPLADSMQWSGTSHGHANLGARQIALEPYASVGTDKAMSWSFWCRPSNLLIESNRIIVCGPTGSSLFSYIVGLQPMSASSNGGCLVLLLQTSSGNNISINSSTFIRKGRVTFVTITYDGLKLNTGLKIYINGVEDTGAVRASAGTYNGLPNDSTARIQFGAVNSAALAYGGDLKQICIWNRVLTLAEHQEMYNGSIPLSDAAFVSMSWYAAAITAFWPAATDLNCTNNATYNMGTITNIATRNSNFGVSLESMSFFNGYPANTRYLAFGQIIDCNGVLRVIQRSGSSHLVDGKIVKLVLDPVAYSLAAPVTIIDDAADLMCCSSGDIESTTYIVLAAKFSAPLTFLELDRWESTDGLTGETYGSAISMTPTLAGYNWYGPLMRRPNTNEYWIAEPEQFGSDFVINYWKSAAGTWTKQQLFSGSPGGGYQEPTLQWLTDQIGIIVMRSDTLGGLHFMKTTDGGATWSSPTPTGLGVGSCNCAMCLDPLGRIVLVWQDRGPGLLYISYGNKAQTILANPTAWNTSGAIWQSYAADSLDILGYPSIVRRGWNYYIAVSAELTSARADQYIGIGRLD